jgi:putative transposase
VTDQLRSYPAAKADIPELAQVKHVFVKAFLSCIDPIRQNFALPRHQMNAACHRAVLKDRFATWHDWSVTAASQKAT